MLPTRIVFKTELFSCAEFLGFIYDFWFIEKITYFANLRRVKINQRLIGAVFINRNRSAADFLKVPTTREEAKGGKTNPTIVIFSGENCM